VTVQKGLSELHQALSTTEEIIEDARNGRMFILVDQEDRENEGDLVIPAQMVTPETINFMAKHGRGLICLAMTQGRIKELGIDLMSRHNETRHATAFTVSIEAREGVTTGISAHDRARTIQVAIDPTRGARDIVTPGHVFPLVARDGGVLVRAGHTEASVDIARLAGLNSAGVICEIMNDDGTMARLPDLVQFAQLHGLKIGTIADLIAYRRRHDKIVKRVAEVDLDSRFGGRFRLIVYLNTVEQMEHVALVKGDVASGGPVPVRMHAMNMLDDLLGDLAGSSGLLQNAMKMIGAERRGVVVLVRDLRATGLSAKVRHKAGERVDEPVMLRDYGVGAQILLDLGVKEMILLTNRAHRIAGLEGYGLTIVGARPIPLSAPPRNREAGNGV
jgi:3,4-dihydroxy 2-butanone 4-phosphate synthase / GTP cyclohydrolase II